MGVSAAQLLALPLRRNFSPDRVIDLDHLAPVESEPDWRCGPPCASAGAVRTSSDHIVPSGVVEDDRFGSRRWGVSRSAVCREIGLVRNRPQPAVAGSLMAESRFRASDARRVILIVTITSKRRAQSVIEPGNGRRRRDTSSLCQVREVRQWALTAAAGVSNHPRRTPHATKLPATNPTT